MDGWVGERIISSSFNYDMEFYVFLTVN